MRFLPLLALALVCLQSASLAQTTRSADFYLNAPEKYLGKQITLPTAYVSRWDKTESGDTVIFSAYTVGRAGSDSGFITVAVPAQKAESFARRYGHTSRWNHAGIDTRLLRGVLRKFPDRDIYFLEVNAD